MVKRSENFSVDNKHVVVNVNVSIEVPDLCEDLNNCARMNSRMPVNNIPVGTALPISPKFGPNESVVPFKVPIKVEPKECEMDQICSNYQEKGLYNPRSLSTASLIEVSAYPDPFGSRNEAQTQENGCQKSKSQMCVNARDYSLDSLKEIFALPSNFLNDDAATKTAVPHHGSPFGFAPSRRNFSSDSLLDLAGVPSFSQIALPSASPKRGCGAIVEDDGSAQQQYFTLTPIELSASGKPLKYIAKPVPQVFRGVQRHLNEMPGKGNEPIILHCYSPTRHGGVADGHRAKLSTNLSDIKIPADAEKSLVTQDLRPKIKPTSIAVDFELTEWNAFEKLFAGIRVRPCFFHLQKSIVRNVCDQGGKVLYDSNDEFRQEDNCLAAIAFVSPEDVSFAFESLREYFGVSKNADRLQTLMDYFEDTYIGRPTTEAKRRKPRYPSEKWNLKKLLVTNQPRTSNGMESFNGQMIRTLAASHPTIWKLIEGLRNEFALSQQRVAARRAGEHSPRRGIACRQLDERLKNTVKRYNEMSKVEFLQSIAINLGRIQVFTKPNEIKKEAVVNVSLNQENSPINDTEPEELYVNNGATINQADLCTLAPRGWLNDKVIDFYLEMVVQRSRNNSKIPRVYALSCHFYTALTANGYSGVQSWIQVDLFAYNIVLIPINLPGYCSLIAIDMEKKVIKCYDSLRSDGMAILYGIWQFLVDDTAHKQKLELGKDAWTYHTEEGIPLQNNGFDCGVFTCQYAEYLSRVAPFTFNQEQMSGLREKMTEEIQKGELKELGY